MKCTTCPHEVGDATDRDCAFPDCNGGWEQVYLDSQEHIAELEQQLENLSTKVSKLTTEDDVRKIVAEMIDAAFRNFYYQEHQRHLKIIEAFGFTVNQQNTKEDSG